jgi:hypoxanthine phosphoribosyltransferase
MDVTDWRAVSQHYVREVVAKAAPGLAASFTPTLLVAASDDALAVARVLRDALGTRPAARILSPLLQVVDDHTNPYHQHTTPFTDGFNGHHILIVDKADNSRCVFFSHGIHMHAA